HRGNASLARDAQTKRSHAIRFDPLRSAAGNHSARRSQEIVMTTMKNTTSNKQELPPKQRDELIKALKARFEKNPNRHKGLEWARVQARLEANSEKLWSLNEMERTGGEPDVMGQDKKTGEYIFFDCSTET